MNSKSIEVDSDVAEDRESRRNLPCWKPVKGSTNPSGHGTKPIEPG